MRRRLLIYLRLGLVAATLLILLAPVLVAHQAAAAGADLDGRLVRLEVQMATIQEQHKLLLGLIVADLVGTIALLRKKAVEG